MTVESQTIFLKIRFIKNMSRLALSSIKNRGEGSWALCTSFLIPDTLRLHTPNACNNPFSPPPIKNPRSASEQSHPIMGSKGLALPSNQCWPGSNPCRHRRHVWVSLLLVLSFASKAFCPGAGVFPTPQKPTFPFPNWMCYL